MFELRAPRWVKPLNMFLMAVQKLGIPAGPAMVLTVPGRKSGKPRSTPLTPFEHDGGLYAVANYPGADWGGQRPCGGRRNAFPRPQVAARANRRTQPCRSGSRAAQVRDQGAGRRRGGQADGAGTRGHSG